MKNAIRLRAATEDDLPIFFEQQLDPRANQMAAFAAFGPAGLAVAVRLVAVGRAAAAADQRVDVDLLVKARMAGRYARCLGAFDSHRTVNGTIDCKRRMQRQVSDCGISGRVRPYRTLYLLRLRRRDKKSGGGKRKCANSCWENSHTVTR